MSNLIKPCPVCGVWVEAAEDYRCRSSASCPCYGMRANSSEAAQAANRHYLGLDSRRAMTGSDYLDQMERREWLDLEALKDSVEFYHYTRE